MYISNFIIDVNIENVNKKTYVLIFQATILFIYATCMLQIIYP